MSSTAMSGTAQHPWSLNWLVSIEMWERFGFYCMVSILALFMIDPVSSGGLGFGEEITGEIYGTFMALCYFMPFIGGMLAERALGFRRSILIGAIFMAVGYYILGFTTVGSTYLGLGLVAFGNGFFKPNIGALLGKFYKIEGKDSMLAKLEDAGFKRFYMGINFGALLSIFAASVLRIHLGWGVAFVGAGIGMTLAVAIVLFKYKALAECDTVLDEFKAKQASGGDTGVSLGQMAKFVLPPAIVLGIIGYFVGGDKWTTVSFLLACVPVIAFFIVLWRREETKYKARIGALFTALIFVIPFVIIYALNGTALTYWGKNNTNRTVTNPSIAETTAFLGMAETVDRDSYYFENVPKEDLPEEGTTISAISTELFQAINPFLVLLFIPFLEGFLAWMAKRRRAIPPAVQIGIGLLISTLAMVVMYQAVQVSADGAIKVSFWWLAVAYFFATLAETFVFPTAIALVSILSPKHLVAVIMGGKFMLVAIGFKLSGFAASYWKTLPHDTFFVILAVMAFVFGAIALMVAPWIKRQAELSTEE